MQLGRSVTDREIDGLECAVISGGMAGRRGNHPLHTQLPTYGVGGCFLKGSLLWSSLVVDVLFG